MAGYLPQNRGNRSANRIGSTVSRRLRAANVNISPSARKHRHPGTFVSTAGNMVSVFVDTDLDARNERIMGDVQRVVAAWPEATGWSTTDVSGAILIHFFYEAA